MKTLNTWEVLMECKRDIMGLISDMETVSGREIARLILLMFILLVLFPGFVALLLFLFIHFGLMDTFFPPFYTLSSSWPVAFVGGIFLVIPFWLSVWWFLAKYNFGKKIFVSEK
jgi:hypothetical protein